MSGAIDNDDWDTPSVAPTQAPTNYDSNIRSKTFSNSERPGRGRGRGGGGGGFRGRGGGDRGGDRRNDFGGGRRDDFGGGGGRRDDFGGGGGRRDDFGGSWRDNRGRGGRDDYGGGSRNNFGGDRRDGFNRRDDRNDGNWRNKDQDRGRRDDNRNGDGGESETMMVPSRLIGKVIGRGGSKISDLQFESSAKIQVTKETEGDDTVIKIFGSPEEISKAKELIEMTIEEKPRPEPVKMVDYGSAPQTDNFYQAENPWAPSNANSPQIDWKAMLEASEAAAEAEWAKIPPIIKYFYQEHPDVTALTEEQVAEIRENNNNIVVNRTFETENSKPIPKPVVAFEHAFFNYPEIMEEIRKQGFEKPSPIQCQAWPVLLTGEDLIGIAQTGTGKTLAFLLPALIHIEGQAVPRSERFGPTVIVMAPTRELALQIDKEVKKYQYRNIKSVCVYGGGDRKAQVDVVTSGVDIVIATPGRMNDLYAAGHLNIKSVSYVVLDEADRMLDMGFEPQIRKVMYSLRPTRQCIMTSATWPPGVRALAKSYMTDPIQVYVGSLDLAATHTVTQTIQMINEEEKENFFYDFVENLGPDDKIIVFCGSKAKADYLSVELSMKGVACAALHGNRDQCDREQAVQDIGDGTVRILIATDVASRGLDINDITHVLNFDFPRNIEEYVHRVGRTGRAGKSGQSISFFSRKDWTQAGELIKILEEAGQYVPEDLVQMAERWEAKKEQDDRGGFSGRGGGRGRGGRGRRDDFAFTGEMRIGGGGGGGGGGGRRDRW